MIRRPGFLSRFSRFRREEDGTVTVEFAIILPFMFAIFVMTFELGMLLARQVMLDRGLDMTVRAVRLGALNPADFNSVDDMHDVLKNVICNSARMIPDCQNNLRLEMQAVNPRNFTNIPLDADCVDRADADRDLRRFEVGAANQMVILRACALYDPYMPTGGLGARLVDNETGAYAMVSVSAFVVEPGAPPSSN